MLDSSEDQVSTACAAAAIAELIRARAIPVESCVEQLLQTVQQATSTLAGIDNSRNTWTEPEQYALTILHYALSALSSSSSSSSSIRGHITPATLPVLLDVLKLRRRHCNVRSQDDAARASRLAGLKRLDRAQDDALSILERFACNTAGRQDFAAAGGIKVLQSGAAAGALWFYGIQRNGLCLLCDLAEDPAVAEAVVEAGAVKVLLDCLHPTCIEHKEACLAAHALAQLAATSQGGRGIAATPGNITKLLKALSATYKRCSEEAGLTFHGLSLCLFRLARNEDCSRAVRSAGGVPAYVKAMVDAGLDEQQVRSELRDRGGGR